MLRGPVKLKTGGPFALRIALFTRRARRRSSQPPATAMKFPRVLRDALLWRRPPSHLRKPTPLQAAPADLPTRLAPSRLYKPAASRCLTTIPPRSTERLTWATDLIGPCVQMRRCGASAPLRLDGTNKRSVLRLCLHQNRNVGVGVFPEGEKIPVGKLCLGLVARESEGST